MQQSRIRLIAITVIALLLLAACGPKEGAPAVGGGSPGAATGDTPGTGTGTTTGGKPAVGGQLRLALSRDPDLLNPIYYSASSASDILRHTHDYLFEFNTDWQPTPAIAESWDIADDNLTITLDIRKGIKWHDGTELTAHDVVFTLGSIMDPGYVGPRKSSVNTVESIEATDDYTVVIVLKEPYAPVLDSINFRIMQQKQFEGVPVGEMAEHEASMNPIGTGPYKLKEYIRGQYVLLERNPDWFRSEEHGGAPFFESILYSVIPDEQTRLAAFENRELSYLAPSASDVDRILAEYSHMATPYEYLNNGWNYISLQNETTHLSDKRVRQALTYGLNRQEILDIVFEGKGVVPVGPITPISWAYDPSVPMVEYNPEKAVQLLEEAGYVKNAKGIFEKNGEPLSLQFYGSSDSRSVAGVTAIARKNWLDIGIEIDLQLMDYSAMSDNHFKTGKFDLAIGGMSLSIDPDPYSLFHSSIAVPNKDGKINGYNRARYKSAEMDDLIERGRTTFDIEERKQIYSRLQHLFVEDAPVIMVSSGSNTHFVDSRIKGVVNMPGSGPTPTFAYRWYINEQ